MCVCCFLTQVLFKCFFFFNLFIFGRAGSLLLHGLLYSCVFSLEQGPLSSFRARTSCGVVASLVEPDSRAEAQQLWRGGRSWSAACGISPDQGWNPCLLHWQVDSFPLSHQGSPTLCVEPRGQFLPEAKWQRGDEGQWEAVVDF